MWETALGASCRWGDQEGFLSHGNWKGYWAGHWGQRTTLETEATAASKSHSEMLRLAGPEHGKCRAWSGERWATLDCGKLVLDIKVGSLSQDHDEPSQGPVSWRVGMPCTVNTIFPINLL